MTNLSNIVEILAKQALGGQQQNQNNTGLGGILGSVLGGMTGQTNHSSQQGGLGGILGSVLGGLTGQASPAQQNGRTVQTGSAMNTQTILIAVVPLILSWIQKNGGLQGALDQLKKQGLSSQVNDWVSTGPGANAAVQPQHVQNLFDQDEVEQIAQQTQVPQQQIYGAITSVLPEIIDALTPQANQTDPQEANQDIEQVLKLVSGFFRK